MGNIYTKKVGRGLFHLAAKKRATWKCKRGCLHGGGGGELSRQKPAEGSNERQKPAQEDICRSTSIAPSNPQSCLAFLCL